MQKKIIALAIAGLASTAAFAQSNVTIYGSLDYGYAYRTDARKPAGTNSTINNARGVADSSSKIDGGQAQGNRLGFKGVEDLGNGLKAVFLIEQGFLGDTGASPANSNTAASAPSNPAAAAGTTGFTRQAYVGLAGNFGTLIGGRLYTPYWSFTGAIDPFGHGTVGEYVNVSGADQNALLNVARVDNAVAYVSPSFGGFTLTGAYSNNAVGADSTVDNSLNNTVYALLGQYTGGPVTAGVNYHIIQLGSSSGAVSANNDIQNLTAGGVFDAKVLKVHALYSWNKIDVANAPDVLVSNYMIGATVPFGKATLKTSYTFSDGNTRANGNAQQFAVGANYALSKRTDLYTAYSLIDNDAAYRGNVRVGSRQAAVGDASNTGFASTAVGTTVVPYQAGFQVGVRHTF